MEAIAKALRKRLKGAERVAIVGIGSSIRRDDSLGLLLIRRIRQKLISYKTKKIPAIKLFSCETTPENFTGRIKKFAPSHVIIVDAAEMGFAPGTIRILLLSKASNPSFSTHSLSLKVFSDYLKFFLGCKIICIGIQPQIRGFGKGISHKIGLSVKKLSGVILRAVR